MNHAQWLADRLAIALSVIEGLELDAGLERDGESAQQWRELYSMLTGPDCDALEAMREGYRKEGRYHTSLAVLRTVIRRETKRAA